MRPNIKEAVAACVLVLVTGLLIAVVLIEWAAGCGEHYIDARGTVHINQCVFITLQSGLRQGPNKTPG